MVPRLSPRPRFSLRPASRGAPAAGPVPMVGPSVLGTAAAGKRLTGLSGTWGGFGAITYRFQWYRCNAAGAACLSIHGATSPTYALGDRDVGKTLGLTVNATDSTGTASAFSSLVGPIAPPRPLLESTAQPVVTGPPVVGQDVQVTTGTWSPTPPKLAYRWLRCNANGARLRGDPERDGQLLHGRGRPTSATRWSRSCRRRTARRSRTPSAPPRRAVVAAAVPRPAADGRARRSTALRSSASSSARRPGSGRASARSSSRSSWYRCDPAGAPLQGDSAARTQRLHAGREGRRQDDRPHAARGRLDRHGDRVREPDRPGRRRRRRAHTDHPADDLRHRARRRRAHVERGPVDVEADAATPTPGCAATRTAGSARAIPARPATAYRPTAADAGTRSSSRSAQRGRSGDAAGAHCRNRARSRVTATAERRAPVAQSLALRAALRASSSSRSSTTRSSASRSPTCRRRCRPASRACSGSSTATCSRSPR